MEVFFKTGSGYSPRIFEKEENKITFLLTNI